MSTPILATKLYIPPPRPKVVLRPRLIEQLNEGLAAGCSLTLISASAGFGKTTLISEWVAERMKDEGGRMKVAWLSLDAGDSDPVRFLAYLVAALQTLFAGIGAGVAAALESPQPPPTEILLTTLINEITAIPDTFILVLDDYHLVDAAAVDDALTFLLQHQPPQMHLVIATREDPQLPLARLRGRGQMTELRAADLRFTPAEAAEFLNRVMGLHLSAENIAALETRTEGWIAGLQLAALSMQGHASRDAAGFIKSFTGSHHFVLDYLVEEVLGQQSASVQAFLLRTSILDRLCGPLCDAVTGIGESANRRISKSANRRIGESRIRHSHIRMPSWNISNTPTCLLSHWTTSGVGTVITISLRNCCGSGCTKAHLQGMKRAAWPNTTSVPAYGTKTMAWRPKPFAMRLSPMTLNAPSG